MFVAVISYCFWQIMTAIQADCGNTFYIYTQTFYGLFWRIQTICMLQRSDEWMRHKADKLKENVRKLIWTSNDVVAKMNLVDAIQRLGIGHLFEDEISCILSDIHKSEFTSSSLHEVALRFHLLREHGLWVSPGTYQCISWRWPVIW